MLPVHVMRAHSHTHTHTQGAVPRMTFHAPSTALTMTAYEVTKKFLLDSNTDGATDCADRPHSAALLPTSTVAV